MKGEPNDSLHQKAQATSGQNLFELFLRLLPYIIAEVAVHNDCLHHVPKLNVGQIRQPFVLNHIATKTSYVKQIGGISYAIVLAGTGLQRRCFLVGFGRHASFTSIARLVWYRPYDRAYVPTSNAAVMLLV
eukprot:1326056-Amphidinium_carterae.1